MTELGAFEDYVSMRPRARVLGALLVATALVTWIAVGCDLAQLHLFDREFAGAEVSIGQKRAYRATGLWVFGIQTVLLVASGVAFVEWLYQSRINLRAFGVDRLQYRRSWAFAGFLVPFLNLVRPYQVIREIWKASDPRTTDPLAWMSVRTGWLIPLWWAAFVTWAVLELVAWGMVVGASHVPEKLHTARGVATVADVAAALGVSFAYFVVDHISEAQEQKWRLWSEGREPALEPAAAIASE